MQRITVFISDEAKHKINLTAKAKHKIESEVIREAIDTGLNLIYPKNRSAQGLLDMAKLAENLPSEHGSPTNVSENIDFYAWGGPKKRGS